MAAVVGCSVFMLLESIAARVMRAPAFYGVVAADESLTIRGGANVEPIGDHR